jgi:hypothetical protein
MHAAQPLSFLPAPKGSISGPDSAPCTASAAVTSGAAPVQVCLSPGVLLTVLQPGTGLAVWHRAARVGLHRAIQAALGQAPFCKVAEGRPEHAVKELLREMPLAMRPLGEDITRLGRLFATVIGEDILRFRLEHVADNACRQHHVDSVRLRLLCTYVGLGTEWIDPTGEHRRMSVFHVGLFKGSKFPDPAPRILHRSPPVEHLAERRRSRLLLCIDQPGVF